MKQEYYFQQMNREEKQVYRAMYDGFYGAVAEFPVLRLERKELSEIFSGSRLDHPAIFYVQFHLSLFRPGRLRSSDS